MDGLNLLFLIFIYILGGLFLIGLLLIFIGLANKDKKQVRQGIVGISIPVSLTLIYILYQFFSDAFLFKPTTQELVGVYRVSDAKNLHLDKSDYSKCQLIIESDTTYVFLASPVDNTKEAGSYTLNYDKPFHELTFFSNKGLRNGHIDRQTAGFSIRLDISGEDSRQSLYFKKIKQRL